MTDTPDVWLVVASGWGVRTFLQTEVFDRLASSARVGVLAAPQLAAGLRELLGRRAQVAQLSPFDATAGRFGAAQRRRNYHFDQLSATGTRRWAEQRHRSTLRRRWRRQLVHFLLRWEAVLMARRQSIDALEAIAHRAFLAEYPYRRRYEELLCGARIVVSTAPYLAEEAPPIIVARHRGRPTAAWITSWDNLTSKPAFFSRYDLYLLWSARMQQDLDRYYPESAASLRAIIGVPHFEWYRDPAMVGTREELCRHYGFATSRPIILYAGATPHLAPGENLVVRRLAEDLAIRPEATRPQLLVRLHPGDGGGRYAAWSPPPGVVIEVPGADGRGRLEGFCPSKAENRRLVASVRHADIVVNLASTITLEAALCDRPVVNVGYDLTPGAPYQRVIDAYYSSFDHYRTVVASGAVRVARSPAQLLASIDAYLAEPAGESDERRALAALWCGSVDGQTGERAAHALLSLAAGAP